MSAEDISPLPENFEAELAAQPHDAYFKMVFSHLPCARALLTRLLPAQASRAADWDSLRLVPGSFVAQDLKQNHSDLLFSLELGGISALIHVILEHQTTVPASMPLRLLGYMVHIWEQHEKKHGPPLPPVLPVVLHQGPETWNVSTQFSDLITAPPECLAALMPHIPRFEHVLLDLTRADPALAADEAMLEMVLRLMMLARQKRRMEEFFEWLNEQVTQLFPDWLLRLSLFYALHADDEIDIRAVCHRLHKQQTLQAQVMSTAEKLKRDAKEEGRVEGRWSGKIQLLESMLGFPQTDSDELDHLTLETLRQRFQELEAEYTRRHKA